MRHETWSRSKYNAGRMHYDLEPIIKKLNVEIVVRENVFALDRDVGDHRLRHAEEAEGLIKDVRPEMTDPARPYPIRPTFKRDMLAP